MSSKDQGQPTTAQSAPDEYGRITTTQADGSSVTWSKRGSTVVLHHLRGPAPKLPEGVRPTAWELPAQSAPAGAVADGSLPWTSEQLARAWYLAEYGPGHDLAPGYAVTFARELAAMLAAAPQPAARQPLELSISPEWVRKAAEAEQGHVIAAGVPDPAARQEQGDEVRRLREALRSSRRVVESASLYAASERHKEFAGAVLVEIDAALSASAEGK